MELFIPSLTLLLLAVALVYFWLPNFAAPMLIAGSVGMLVIALYVHVKQFGRAEYEQATWQYNLRNYSSYVIIGAILLGAYGFYAMNNAGVGATGAVAPVASPAMPPLAPPLMGGGLSTVMKTASSRIHELMRRGRISTD
jgi:hypothetical protein